MEVTRRNFKEVLPLVKESVDKADFIVIDAEFTGLMNGPDVTIFDTPEEYYSRLYKGTSEFLLIQYGVCMFHWDKDHYVNNAYNFYLFPRGKPGPDRKFLCQSSSLDFLAAQGFDFNKVFKDGISYMTEPTESRLRESLKEKQNSYSNEKDNIPIPQDNKQQIEDYCKKVREFIDKNESDEMEIDRCNAFIRRLLFQELGNKFKDEVLLETKMLENQNRVLKVIRIKSPNDGVTRHNQIKEKEWEEFEDAVGFSKVARMISQCGKLVVGHNMLLDVMHTLSHFFQPLPPDYQSFKEFAHCMFPKLLDTKYMSFLPPFKDKVKSTVLQHLLTTLSESPFSIPKTESETGRGYRMADDRAHEAGYDAFVTGLCFASMLHHVGGGPPTSSAALSAAARPFLNKLFLARTAHQDSPYINLIGPEPTPVRDHVFHLTFPVHWQRSDINQLFSPFGQVTVQFVDESSAMVALSRREQAKDVMRALYRNPSVTLIPYAKYKTNTIKSLETDADRKWLRRADNPSPPDSAVKTFPVKSYGLPGAILATPTKLIRRVGAEKAPAQLSVSTTARSRSNSDVPIEKASRKRTSSGVFEVNNEEPVTKKPDKSRSSSETDKKKVAATNGCSADGDDSGRKQTKVIEEFDSKAKNNCVEAFKESDNWD